APAKCFPDKSIPSISGRTGSTEVEVVIINSDCFSTSTWLADLNVMSGNFFCAFSINFSTLSGLLLLMSAVLIGLTAHTVWKRLHTCSHLPLTPTVEALCLGIYFFPAALIEPVLIAVIVLASSISHGFMFSLFYKMITPLQVDSPIFA